MPRAVAPRLYGDEPMFHPSPYPPLAMGPWTLSRFTEVVPWDGVGRLAARYVAHWVPGDGAPDSRRHQALSVGLERPGGSIRWSARGAPGCPVPGSPGTGDPVLGSSRCPGGGGQGVVTAADLPGRDDNRLCEIMDRARACLVRWAHLAGGLSVDRNPGGPPSPRGPGATSRDRARARAQVPVELAWIEGSRFTPFPGPRPGQVYVLGPWRAGGGARWTGAAIQVCAFFVRPGALGSRHRAPPRWLALEVTAHRGGTRAWRACLPGGAERQGTLPVHTPVDQVVAVAVEALVDLAREAGTWVPSLGPGVDPAPGSGVDPALGPGSSPGVTPGPGAGAG